MRRLLLLTALALLCVFALALPAGAASSPEFKAQFHDDDCLTHAQCGTGLVEGYGHVTTTLDLGGVFDPATDCLTDVTAVRNVELDSDPSSTLTLDLTNGLTCDNKSSATLTISAATGVFAGLVVLPGMVRVTLIPGVPGDTAQYRATIVSQ